MDIEEINKLWSEDSNIDISNLSVESLNIPKLHNKYYKIYIEEKKELNKLESGFNRLKDLKYDYYNNRLSPEDLHELQWLPYNRTLKPSEIQSKLDSDSDLIKINLLIVDHREKVLYLESIIKMIFQLSFNIKNSIEFIKFSEGIN